MEFLKRFRRKKTATRMLRPTPLLPPTELALWDRAILAAPDGTRVSAAVVVDLMLEGDLGEEVSGYVVPFAVFTSDGHPLRVYLPSDAPEVREVLLAAGIEVRELSELSQDDHASAEADAPPGVEGAAPPAMLPHDPPETHTPEGGAEEGAQLPPDAAPLEEDVARLFWEGKIGAAELLRWASGSSEEEQAESEGGEERGSPVVPSCPKCGAPMVLKVARRGRNAGKKFWSCSRYPECKGTRPYKEE